MRILEAIRAFQPHLREFFISTDGKTRLRREELWLSTHNVRTGAKPIRASEIQGILKQQTNKQMASNIDSIYQNFSHQVVLPDSHSHSLSCFLYYSLFIPNSSSLFLFPETFLNPLEFIFKT